MYKAKRSRRVRFGFIFLLMAVLLASASTWLYIQPLPALYPVKNQAVTALSKPASSLSWPSSGDAAVGAVGYGVLAISGAQTPRPTASVAKVITALAVLKQHPLTLNETGPTLTLDGTDVAFYNQYVAQNGSVATVQAGEQISEYQALETLLLPSANNMADSLARWAYGSLDAYTTAANQLVKSWGLTHTTVGSDASGLSPSTLSTASDLLNLGFMAMKDPVLAQIVSQKQASVPVAGIVTSTNQLLGLDGIIGIKTGNTDQAGGVFVSAATEAVGDKNITLVSAVMGVPDLQTALDSTKPLLNSAKGNFTATTLANAGDVVGTYNLPWGGSVEAIAQHDISVVIWRSNPIKSTASLQTVYAPLTVNTPVGLISYTSGSIIASTSVVLKQQLPSPPWWWRIVRHKL